MCVAKFEKLLKKSKVFIDLQGCVYTFVFAIVVFGLFLIWQNERDKMRAWRDVFALQARCYELERQVSKLEFLAGVKK